MDNKIYEMSSFSSIGPLPNLELKPEITAPGGNIYSSVPTITQDEMVMKCHMHIIVVHQWQHLI